MTDMTLEGVTDADMGADHAAARRYGHIGAALIMLAFVAPLAAAAFGVGSANSAGQRVGETLGALLFLTGIAWLVTRKSSDLAKAKGRMVVGLLLCLTGANNVATAARDEREAKEFVRGAMEMSARQESKFVELGKRFEAATLGQYSTPRALTSPQSLAAAQAALEHYRSLLQERKQLLQAQIAESQAFVGNAPSAGLRRGAESSLGATVESIHKVFEDLDVAQRAHADSLGELFTWAQNNTGKLSMRGNQLMLQTAQQQAELKALASRLQEAEVRVDQAVKLTTAEMGRLTARREQALKEAAAFLGR